MQVTCMKFNFNGQPFTKYTAYNTYFNKVCCISNQHLHASLRFCLYKKARSIHTCICLLCLMNGLQAYLCSTVILLQVNNSTLLFTWSIEILSDISGIINCTSINAGQLKFISPFLENFPPSISGDAVFRVTIGEMSSYTFTVSDEQDTLSIDVTVLGGLPPGSTLEEVQEGHYVFNWILLNPTNQNLTFEAIGKEGAVSVLVPRVEICGCMNGGKCKLPNLFLFSSTIIMDCACPEG